MGIYIKGMEMPVIELEWTIRRGADGKWYAIDTNAETSDGEWHEIVPVPAHGDLIDRKALLADTTDMIYSMMVFGGARVYTSDAIKAAPTIIPAEEGE